MDALSIFIVVVATVTAIAFKIFLFKRIRKWADQDLIRSLSENNPSKREFLQSKYLEMVESKTPLKELHDKLTEISKNYSEK